MKQIVCEMCGSTDIIKQDGIFMCQSCGMKYSLEEAKKMMIEGTVSVQGTVKIDNSESYNNYLSLIDDAFVDGRFDSAYSNVVQALTITPTDELLIARQGLAVLGNEKFLTSIPTSTTNGLDRAIDAIKNNTDSKKKLFFAITVINDLNNVDKFVGNFFRDQISDLRSQMVEERGASAKAVDALFNAQIVAVQNQRDDEIKRNHNAQLEKQIDAINQRIRTLSSYVNNYKSKISKIKEEAQVSVNEEYWNLNESLKNDLNSEKENLQNKRDELNKKLEECAAIKEQSPLKAEYDNLCNKIKELQAQRDSLGVFKIKEKKALEKEIEELAKQRTSKNNDLYEYNKQTDEKYSPIRKEIREAETRIREIETEFKKNRSLKDFE